MVQIYKKINCIKWERRASERDLGEWRAKSGRGEKEERKYMFIYNFHAFYTFAFLYKVRQASERARSGRVVSEIWERGERGMKIYVHIQFSLALYKHKCILYNLRFLYKVREASERARFGRGERGERKYMYIYNFLLLYTNTSTLYTLAFV